MLLYINYKKRGIIEYIKSGNQSQKTIDLTEIRLCETNNQFIKK